MAKVEMAAIGREMLAFQEQLARDYGYAPIGYNLFLGDIRQKYIDALPEWCKMMGDSARLFSLHGTLLADGYERIVVGDYGAFVEIQHGRMHKENICVAPGQEYRIQDPRFRDHVKYFWYTAKDSSGVKIYFQQKMVTYADYREGMYYISPYELQI